MNDYTGNYQHAKARPRLGNQNARKFSTEVAAARGAEMRRRNSTAMHRAHTVLARMHPEEFTAYLEIARNEVRVERGPLPGDE